MFEKATRQKVRFDTDKGRISVEDLWDLPLTSKSGAQVNLDDIAKGLFAQLQSTVEVSFVSDVKPANELLKLKFDVVKHIIDVKLAERDTAAVAAKNREQKQLILGIIEQKKNEALSGASLEDLEKMAAAL